MAASSNENHPLFLAYKSALRRQEEAQRAFDMSHMPEVDLTEYRRLDKSDDDERMAENKRADKRRSAALNRLSAAKTLARVTGARWEAHLRPAPAGSVFYVTAVDGDKVAFLAGPFASNEDAARYVEPARSETMKRFRSESAFAAFGTVAAKPRGPGVMNEVLGIVAEEKSAMKANEILALAKRFRSLTTWDDTTRSHARGLPSDVFLQYNVSTPYAGLGGGYRVRVAHSDVKRPDGDRDRNFMVLVTNVTGAETNALQRFDSKDQSDASLSDVVGRSVQWMEGHAAKFLSERFEGVPLSDLAQEFSELWGAVYGTDLPEYEKAADPKWKLPAGPATDPEEWLSQSQHGAVLEKFMLARAGKAAASAPAEASTVDERESVRRLFRSMLRKVKEGGDDGDGLLLISEARFRCKDDDCVRGQIYNHLHFGYAHDVQYDRMNKLAEEIQRKLKAILGDNPKVAGFVHNINWFFSQKHSGWRGISDVERQMEDLLRSTTDLTKDEKTLKTAGVSMKQAQEVSKLLRGTAQATLDHVKMVEEEIQAATTKWLPEIKKLAAEWKP